MNSQHRPFCLYFRKGHGSAHDLSNRYFRVSLDGRLEKSITLSNKLDDNGNLIREGRARFEEDIERPDIQKAFKTEMTYWLKVWLKKQGGVKTGSEKLPKTPPSQETR